MSRQSAARGRPFRPGQSGNPKGRAATVSATEEWNMRVNAEWLARVKVKARDWNVSTAELMRVLIDQGLEGDLSVLFPPRDDPKGRYVPIHERLRKGGRR